MSDSFYTGASWQAPTADNQNTHAVVYLPHYASMQLALEHLDPNDSVNVLFPEVLEHYASEFVNRFPGDVLYAVKANPHPYVLKTLWNAGVRYYDVASLREVEQVAQLLPQAKLFMMHPVKSRKTILRSYELGVREFAFDDMSELEKIKQELPDALDLSLHLRLSLPSEDAAYSLEGKFGASFEMAGPLIKAAKAFAKSVGVTFHVGSQCMDPDAYRRALALLRDLLDNEGLELDSVDVGGGYPVNYPGMEAPDLGQYFEVIKNALHDFGFAGHKVLGEPGRALVAEGGSTLVRVEMRRGNELYLNDGTYGALFDAGSPKWRFPVSILTGDGRETQGALEAFSFWGPTCDAIDHMEGPFLLPADIQEGDWIEVGNLGAYGQTMATKFNGFYAEHTITVDEEPIVWRGPIGSVISG
ncbi:type III PLP-dependent enzyme [Kordiimonas sp. SCSIO 12610]|uniref:type III PLP-dependent enzyme n=1 Tax=Kordiimonas sp. SCSIO 12610 TaxID=2829597 RepID=UPI00210D01AF|nr:type III PLP-dependent enzyme [Kordiimonas sp. SCSIO 12610]UTW55763.1 type III PLP-dependent enzyme [Kordiimonas sp. SCSIO 12610]